MATRSTFRWTSTHTIASDTLIGSKLIDDLLDAMRQRQWSETDLHHVHLAYEEAIINAIVHGNGRAADKKVLVEMMCDREKIRIEITDQGRGFDPNEVPDPRQDEYLEVAGGRGLLLMCELMTDVRYNETGNQVTMTKIKGDNRPPADE